MTYKDNPDSLRVIIVGGGIAGLSAAIALRQRGHDPVVLERASRLEAAGAGITLFGNAMNALDRLGVAEAIRAAGACASHSAILTSDGRVLTTLPADLLDEGARNAQPRALDIAREKARYGGGTHGGLGISVHALPPAR